MESLKEKAAKGFFWGAMNSGVTQLLNLVIGVFLLRLLTPDDYGIVGVLTVFTLVAGNLQACGFSQGLANLKQPTANDYNSVFWFNVIVSIIMYAVLFACAPLIADFFHQPKLVSLSRFTFLAFLISSLGIARNAYMHKNMMNREKAVVGMVALLVSGGCGIALACCGMAYWSLAWQQVIYITVANIGRHHYTRRLWNPTLHFDFKPVRGMFRFSSKMLLTSILNTLGSNVLTFIFGRYLPMRAVGNFTQANKWSTMGYTLITGMIEQVAQPVLVEVTGDEDREKRVFRKMLRFAAFLSFPALFGLSMVAEEFTLLLGSDKWIDSVPLLQLLCVSGAFAPFYTMFQQLVVSNGRSDIYLGCSFMQIVLQVLVVMAFISRGVLVMTTVFCIFYILYLSVWYFMSRKLIHLRLHELLLDICPFCLVSLVIMASVWFATRGIDLLLARLAARMVLAALLYFLTMKWAHVEILNECLRFVAKRKKK